LNTLLGYLHRHESFSTLRIRPALEQSSSSSSSVASNLDPPEDKNTHSSVFDDGMSIFFSVVLIFCFASSVHEPSTLEIAEDEADTRVMEAKAENLLHPDNLPGTTQVMAAWQNKKANALEILVKFVDERPALKEVVFLDSSIPTAKFTKTARSWINKAVRPIMKCLHNHFEDNIMEFQKVFPKVAASAFGKDCCDGSNPKKHLCEKTLFWYHL
jgi:hypothetical protein